MIDEITEAAKAVRERVPLVHNITNYVTVNDVANAELAIGGSALMADDIGEVADMVAIASAENINIGTLSERTIASMIEAGKQANALGKPVVFDPVGAGASALRNDTTRAFLDQVRPTVIRGNISEVSFIAGVDAAARGVDAADADQANDAAAIAKSVAESYRCVVAITGAVDVVSDGKTAVLLSNGTPLMSKITGTGCMCDGVIGCFIGALDDAKDTSQVLVATAGAITSMSLAGQLAERDLKNMGALVGTGSLRVGIIDWLSLLSAGEYCKFATIEVA